VEDHERIDEYNRVQGLREDADKYMTKFCLLAQDIYFLNQDLLDDHISNRHHWWVVSKKKKINKIKSIRTTACQRGKNQYHTWVWIIDDVLIWIKRSMKDENNDIVGQFMNKKWITFRSPIRSSN
jgi:hypothetical protein